MIPVLTDEQLANAHAQLEAIQKIQKLVHDRVQFHDSEEFGLLSEVEQLAYLTVSKAVLDALGILVDALASSLGREFTADNTLQEKLAVVIDLFESGSHRRGSHDPA